MRALAEFIMRGRMQATLVVAGCAALPLLYWLGAAAGCLVLLRRGLKDALGVLALGLLPALIWWLYSDDPRALLVLLGSASLALVLRASESWNRVLLVSIAMGVVFSVVLGTAFGPQIEMLAQALIKVMPSLLGEVYQQMSVDEQARFASLIAPVLTGLIAALLQIVSVLSLLVGRYWQALLYNPGGFGREFRAIRIPLGPAMLLLAGMVVTPNLRCPDVHACAVVQRTAGFRRAGPDSRAGGAKATGQVLAGGVVRHAVAVHAADLSVAGGPGHRRQPD
jgi:hypothetical protein